MEAVEANLKRTASGEVKLNIKGLKAKTVRPKHERSDDVDRVSTVFIDPTNVDLVAEMMGWIVDEDDPQGSES